MNTVEVTVAISNQLEKLLLSQLDEVIRDGYKFKSEEARLQIEDEIANIVENVDDYVMTQIHGLNSLLEEEKEYEQEEYAYGY